MRVGAPITRVDREAGFTLAELLFVIVILGILAAVSVLSVGGVTDRGRAFACETDRETVRGAAEAYYAKSDGHAPSIASLVSAGFLRHAPETGNGYTITYSNVDGSVSSTPACSTL